MADPVPSGPWRRVRSSYAVADRWLRLRNDVISSPDGTTIGPRPVIEQPDWVDAIALTARRSVVLVEQYRHAVETVRTEFPAGTVDDGETPLAAVKRELLEETGYTSDHWRLLGSAPVYPAQQTNRIFSFLALDARRVAGQTLDAGEAIRCRELPFAQFIAEVESGALELPALQLAGLWWLKTCIEEF
jgi:ADP-ribose pyrophosphatase